MGHIHMEPMVCLLLEAVHQSYRTIRAVRAHVASQQVGTQPAIYTLLYDLKKKARRPDGNICRQVIQCLQVEAGIYYKVE